MDKHVVMDDLVSLLKGEGDASIEARIKDLAKAYQEDKVRSRRGLFTTWVWVFKKEFAITCMLTLLKSVCTFSTPFLIQGIIQFIETQDQPLSRGFTFVGLVLLAQLGEYLLQQHIQFNQFKLGAQSTNAVAGLVFRKNLRAGRTSLSTGEITNLI
mmetsp:Transcript_20580/g.31382  ORF Transcript_20580/g.31382 Transcript_20580/m.31382 type:complete len:156 (-) Transcript_20580:639-1106(-)